MTVSFTITGYTLRTLRHRYTEWVPFDTQKFKPDWEYVVARELYDHQLDPAENLNISDRSVMSDTVQILSKQLRAGWRYSLPKHMLAKNIQTEYRSISHVRDIER
jgi:iduronate 2-sulfatase